MVSLRVPALNRTQAVVLGFLGVALICFGAILGLAPDIYAATLNLPAGSSRGAELAFLLALTLFLLLLAIGVLRRWRWTFWLILVAFLAGILRPAASLLQVAGVLTASSPGWYLALQAGLGDTQFVIAIAMIVGYRRSGPWGGF